MGDVQSRVDAGFLAAERPAVGAGAAGAAGGQLIQAKNAAAWPRPIWRGSSGLRPGQSIVTDDRSIAPQTGVAALLPRSR